LVAHVVELFWARRYLPSESLENVAISLGGQDGGFERRGAREGGRERRRREPGDAPRTSPNAPLTLAVRMLGHGPYDAMGLIQQLGVMEQPSGQYQLVVCPLNGPRPSLSKLRPLFIEVSGRRVLRSPWWASEGDIVLAVEKVMPAPLL
jgi:hypothetical protein